MAAMTNTQATVKELKDKAKSLGIKGFNKMKKADLIAAIEEYNASVEEDIYNSYEGYDVYKDFKKHLDSMAEEKQLEGDKLAKKLAIVWMCQSAHSYTNDGRVLFFVSKKYGDNLKISMNSRLIKVTSDLLDRLYGRIEQDKWMLRINHACRAMIDRGYCHEYVGADGKHSIHMTIDEWNKCVKVYKANKKAAKQYVAFVNANK